MKKIFSIVVLGMVIMSCGSQFNKVSKDINEGSKRVYGEIGGPALQLKNTYSSATPETMEKASKFRAQVEENITSAR